MLKKTVSYVIEKLVEHGILYANDVIEIETITSY